MATPISRSWTIPCVFGFSLFLNGPAAGQTFFEEVTEQAMVGEQFQGRTITFGDYNHDGWPDLFFSAKDLPNIALWHNEGNGWFVDRTTAIRGDVPVFVRGGGVISGDYDNDGDLDLYVPNGLFAWGERNALLRNDGGVFQEVGVEANLTDRIPTDNAIWLDYNRDGHIDLYTGNQGTPEKTRNKLYHNNGDGTFVDVTEEAGLDLLLGSDIYGGSNGGMAAGDFDDDGWPDLYVGVWRNPNHLFQNDGQGGFRDLTTSEIAHPGEAYGVAVGDITNNGHLDIFQAAGGGGIGGPRMERSVLLMNLGEGLFIDVTEGVGLTSLVAQNLLGAALGDIDNDGDLDLLIPKPHFLFLNNGDGIFVDHTSQSGIGGVNSNIAFGDYDRDGFLDVVTVGMPENPMQQLYRNTGNDNHWLRVELVGTPSNRSGIGTRVIATTGDVQQTREIGGGQGYCQDEMVAHFGLGPRTTVDRLEIRWPSDQMDVLTDLPVDQHIRIIEGQQRYHPVQPTTWTHNLPDSLVDGTALPIAVTVRPALFETTAEITRITADLSRLGGDASVPLRETEDGIYELAMDRVVQTSCGWKEVWIVIDQETSLGSYRTTLVKAVKVLPAEWPREDRPLFTDAAMGTWQVQTPEDLVVELREDTEAYEGQSVLAFQGDASPFWERPNPVPRWNVRLQPTKPADIGGYRALHFAFHPGEAELPQFHTLSLFVNHIPAKGMWLSLNVYDTYIGRITPEQREWQVVELPLEMFHLDGPLESIHFEGGLHGTFYLDDIRLVAAEPSVPITAVTEDHTSTLPQSFTLSQNFPNPFNSATTIRFALPTVSHVELAIFNLTGQQVATLVSGERQAGTYTIHWDGRDDDGRELASGVYLYRLRTGDGQQVETRKLALIQ